MGFQKKFVYGLGGWYELYPVLLEAFLEFVKFYKAPNLVKKKVIDVLSHGYMLLATSRFAVLHSCHTTLYCHFSLNGYK